MNLIANNCTDELVEAYGKEEKDWNELIPLIKQYVQQNIHSINAVDDVTKHFGVGQREFSEQFSYRMGITPKSFIAYTRFVLLMKILRNTSEKVKYHCVALECGYKSVNALYIAVKRRTGLTIRQFHRKLLKDKSKKVDKFVDYKVDR